MLKRNRERPDGRQSKAIRPSQLKRGADYGEQEDLRHVEPAYKRKRKTKGANSVAQSYSGLGVCEDTCSKESAAKSRTL